MSAIRDTLKAAKRPFTDRFKACPSPASFESVNIRKNNSVLHTWAGLLLGWLLYLVFFTGTLSFYKEELQFWHWPEFHQTSATDQSISKAVAYLQVNAPDSPQWRISTAGTRHSVAQIRWYESGENTRKGNGTYALYDSQKKQLAIQSKVDFSNFLYRLHFELYAMPATAGRIIVGIATLVMLVALITGIIIHRRIFIDFFSWRPGKKLKSWLDLHNLTAVLALPFHLLICYSGVLLVMYLLMPWGVDAAYDGDFKQFQRDGGGKRNAPHYIVEANNADHKVITNPDNLYDIQNFIDKFNARWDQGIAYINIDKRPQKTPTLTIYQRGAQSLLDRASSERWTYNLTNGELIEAKINAVPDSTSKAIYNLTTALHLQRYSEPLQRLLFFIGGLLSTLMIASGLIIWRLKRQRKAHFGTRLVEVLNVGIILGLPLATVIGLASGRILDSFTPNFGQWQINVFWLVIGTACVLSAFASYLQAAAILLKLLAFSSISLVCYNTLFLNSGASLSPAWLNSAGTIISIDLTILTLGIASLYGAVKINKALNQSHCKQSPKKPKADSVVKGSLACAGSKLSAAKGKIS